MKQRSRTTITALAAILIILAWIAIPVAADDSGPRQRAKGRYDASTSTYTVVAGDDLSDIAERFGTTVGELETLNKLTSAQIMVGQKLITVPPAGAQKPHIDLTHTAPIADTKPVTWDNWVRAESDKMFKSYVGLGGFGKLFNIRKPTPIDAQKVVRMNRDTLYSVGVFDLTSPVTITKPDTGDRFQSLMVLNQDEYVPIPVVYKPGKYTLTQDEIGSRYTFVAMRTFVDSTDPADIKKANALQDQIKVQQSSVGKFEIPNWDQKSQDKLRTAIQVLASTMTDTDKCFGTKEDTDEIAHLLGAALGWAGNPVKDAKYINVYPKQNDGKTAYTLTVKDVPVNGFWSISLYNGKGFFVQNQYNAYSINNVTAKKNEDGSITIHFGGDPKQPNYLPIMDGWNYIVRLYRPQQQILDGTWKFPAPQPVK